MLFPPGEAAGVIDERTRTAATRFAPDHGCRFLFDGQSSRFTFLKLPGRWHELIGNLCTDLGRETPGTEDFRINIDHKIGEAEARASGSDRSSVSENFRRRCAKFYARVRTAIRRIKKFGPRPSRSCRKLRATERLTEAIARTARASSSNHGGRRRSRHDLARLKGRVKTGSARNRGEPLGVFLAASLNI
jgi:hypothetical protein